MTPRPQRLKQLDGLRCYAVLLVIWFHWAKEPYKGAIGNLSFGEIGVTLFFVLSGFLITAILTSTKDKCTNSTEKATAIKRFFIRRSLRIFPLYYVTLSSLILLNIPPFRESSYWYLLYLQNIFQKLFTTEIWGSHLWTLAIEEQFYLLWPFLIYWFNRKYFLILFAGIAGMALSYRLLWHLLSDWLPSPNLLLIDYLDCFGIGAIFSYFYLNYNRTLNTRITNYCLVFGVLLLLLTNILPQFFFDFKQTSFSLIAGSIILRASQGFTGLTGWVLSNSTAVYIGTISYGLYITHGLALAYWEWFFWSCPIPGYRILQRLGIHAEITGYYWFTIAVATLITITLSVTSWHLLEKPLNSLKNRFSYIRES
jgi:peptidoglycan/LPS O-acetylase OafA/YrhL